MSGSKEPNAGKDLDMDTRVSNLEVSVEGIRNLILEDRERRKEDKQHRDRNNAFLDTLIRKAEDDALFWKNAKEKIMVQSAWVALGIICYACWYTLKSRINSG